MVASEADKGHGEDEHQTGQKPVLPFRFTFVHHVSPAGEQHEGGKYADDEQEIIWMQIAHGHGYDSSNEHGIIKDSAKQFVPGGSFLYHENDGSEHKAEAPADDMNDEQGFKQIHPFFKTLVSTSGY
jgi:hypothetical protein